MPAFRFTVFERDPDRPWIIVGEPQHLTADLDSASDFSEWVAEHWPRDRFTAELDPGQEVPRLRQS